MPNEGALAQMKFETDASDSKHLTLFRAVIFEGGADYLCELVTGIEPTTEPHYQFGMAHEQQSWQRFQTDRLNTDVSDWIANKSRADWPADMGFYIGYQIAKAFYQNMQDKRLAFHHLTHVDDPDFILRVSQYGAHFESKKAK